MEESPRLYTKEIRVGRLCRQPTQLIQGPVSGWSVGDPTDIR
jgi:hypothetical protein